MRRPSSGTTPRPQSGCSKRACNRGPPAGRSPSCSVTCSIRSAASTPRPGTISEIAANRPKAPNYLSGFAAKLLAQGGSLQTAIEFAEVQLARTVDQRTHDELAERLQALYLQNDLARLNQAAAARLATGQPLTRLEDLIGYGDVSELPAEPFGGTFQLAGTKVVSSNDAKLLHLFVHANDSLIEPSAD